MLLFIPKRVAHADMQQPRAKFRLGRIIIVEAERNYCAVCHWLRAPLRGMFIHQENLWESDVNDKQERALWALLGASVKLADHTATYGKDVSPDLSEKWHQALEHALSVAPFEFRKTLANTHQP